MKKLVKLASAAAVAAAIALPMQSAEAFWGGGPWGGYGWGGWGGWGNPIGYRYYPDWGGYRGPYQRYPAWGWGGWGSPWWGPWAYPPIAAPVVVLPAPEAEAKVEEEEAPSAPEEK